MVMRRQPGKGILNSRTQGAKSESVVHCNLRFVFPRPVQIGAQSALDKVVP